eukprot:SAG31_NODE_3651_length_4025_cov_3.433520_4_plen_158_part_00
MDVHVVLTDPNDLCCRSLGYYPSKSCSAPSCFAYTVDDCCKWRDYSTGEWIGVDGGELRPCSYEIGEDESMVETFRLGECTPTIRGMNPNGSSALTSLPSPSPPRNRSGSSVPSTVFAQIVWIAAAVLSAGCGCSLMIVAAQKLKSKKSGIFGARRP